MITMLVTGAVVSKGYEGAPALTFSENEEYVRFRIGVRSFDKRATDNVRWDNFTVKAFGAASERIKKMKLQEGSYVNMVAKYDVDTWEDKETGEKKSMPVLIVQEVEYCYSGNGKSKDDAKPAEQSDTNGVASPAPPSMPDGFTGFASVGANMFFPGQD